MTSINGVCDEILDVATKIVNPELGPGAVSELANKAGVLMVSLRSLNRQQLLSLDAQTRVVETHKERIDKEQLRLENLLYRQNHLKREIMACKEIDTPELQRVENDLQTKVAMKEYSDDLPQQHAAALQQLQAEHAKRQSYQSLLSERRATLEDLTSQLAKKQKVLDDLPSKLTSIISATSDLEKYFNTSWSTHHRNLEASSSLSAPLYTLYHVLHTHIDSNFSLTTSPELTLTLTNQPLSIAFHSPTNLTISTTLTLFPKQSLLHNLFPEIHISAIPCQYVWVQALCGVLSVPEVQCEVMSAKTVLQRIRSRIFSVAHLQHLIHHLVPATPSLAAPALALPLPPVLSAAYEKFANYASRATIAHLKGLSVMHTYENRKEHCVYVKATVLLLPLAIAAQGLISGPGISTLAAVIELSPEYPLLPPRFILQGQTHDNHLQWLENELNTNCLSVLNDASPSNIEETLNSVLHYQLLLLCLYAPTTSQDVPRTGRNRRGDLVKTFYGRHLV